MHRMSISVFSVGATPLLKTIPTPFEKTNLLEFAFGPEPIIKLVAWEAVTLKIDFICAAPDFFVTWRVVCRRIFCVRLNWVCVKHAQPPLTPPAIAPERPMECCRRALDSVTMLRADITTRAGETQKSQDRQYND